MRKIFKRGGFTLVEMAIVATIMIITSSMLIVFSQSGGNRLVLSAEQAKIGGVLNRAKSLALQRYRGNEETTLCGFAFLFNEPKDSYMLVPVSRSAETGECLEIGAPTEIFALPPTVTFIHTVSDIIIFESPYLTTRNPMTIQIGLKERTNEVSSIEVTSGGAIVLH